MRPEELAGRIAKALGTSLVHYMPSTKAQAITEANKIIHEIKLHSYDRVEVMRMEKLQVNERQIREPVITPEIAAAVDAAVSDLTEHIQEQLHASGFSADDWPSLFDREMDAWVKRAKGRVVT